MRRLHKLFVAGVVAAAAGAVAAPVISGGLGGGSSSPSEITLLRDGVQQTESVPTPPKTIASQTDSLAGYQATLGSTPITSFDGTVVVPTGTCPASGEFTTEVSVQVDGYLSGGSFIELTCTSGSASYAGVVSLNATGKTFAVSPGQKIATRITLATKSGTWTGTVAATDVTTGTTAKASSSTTAGGDTYGWDVAESYPAVTPFGTLPWSGAKVNGSPLLQTTHMKLVTVNNATDGTLVSTSTLSRAGTAFTNTRR
jgi:hypothetical protein